MNEWLQRRRERCRHDNEIVGFFWVWDRPMPMSRKQAEWADRNMLPFGVSVLSDWREATQALAAALARLDAAQENHT